MERQSVRALERYNPEHATRNGSALHDAEILGKPYRKSELARKLRELLDGDGR